MRLYNYLLESLTTKNANKQFFQDGENIIPIVKLEKVDGKFIVFVKGGKSYDHKNLVWTGKKKNGFAIWRNLGFGQTTNTGKLRTKKQIRV